MLCHTRVEVVLYHQHDGSRLAGAVGVFVDGTGMDVVTRTVAVHVDTSILAQFVGELLGQSGVQVFGEIAQGIAQGEALLLVGEDVLALRCVVDIGVVGFRLGELVGNTGSYLILEFFGGHGIKV